MQITHHGLDAMMQRLINEMTLMTQDNNTDVFYNSSRYNYMYMVGTKDLYEGLQSAAQLFVDNSVAK